MRYKLFSILVLGFFLRILFITDIPSGFTPDEASFGYDAYSILKTGKDQWGKTLPLVLESFGDFKSPLYTYLTIPSVLVFGLNKFSTRLPNVLFGTFAIYATYLLVSEIKKSIREDKLVFQSQFLPFFASLLIAISPWHIMMSRGAFEANLTTFFLPFSLYLFLKGLKNPKYFVFAVFIAGLNIFTYHSAKLVTPLFFLFAVFVFRREIFRKIGKFHLASVFLIFIFSFLFILSLKTGSATRIKDVNIFRLSLIEASSERSKAISMGLDPFLARLIYNKYQAGLRHLVSNYFSYFSPQFYFSNGPAEATYGMIPGRGVIYWFELPFLVSFFIYLGKKFKNKALSIILFWFFLAPIPAALSLGPGYAANRAVIQIPSIQILSAIGAVFLFAFIRKLKFGDFIKKAYLLVSSIFLIYFFFDYFLVSPTKIAKGMLYGRLEVAYWLSQNAKDKSIVVSRALSEPHIYIAFANKIDPRIFQNATKLWNYKSLGLSWVDQVPSYRMENYIFENIDISKYANSSNYLLVGKPEEFRQGIKPFKIFFYPNGEEALYVVQAPIISN